VKSCFRCRKLSYICIFSASLIGTVPAALWIAVIAVGHGAAYASSVLLNRYSPGRIVDSCFRCRKLSYICIFSASLIGTVPAALWIAVIAVGHGAAYASSVLLNRYSPGRIVDSCCHYRAWSCPCGSGYKSCTPHHQVLDEKCFYNVLIKKQCHRIS
jgi:uncharacterized protein YqfA (UPF0365 family)